VVEEEEVMRVTAAVELNRGMSRQMHTDLHHNAVKAAMLVVGRETQKDQRKALAVIMHR
jgi:predicted GNAT superfamily acetyltransferase